MPVVAHSAQTIIMRGIYAAKHTQHAKRVPCYKKVWSDPAVCRRRRLNFSLCFDYSQRLVKV